MVEWCRFDSIFFRPNNTEEIMSQLMRLNLEESYFDKEMLEESHSDGTTVIPFTREASLHILQCRESDHNLTVSVRKERNGLKFMNRYVPNRASSRSSAAAGAEIGKQKSRSLEIAWPRTPHYPVGISLHKCLQVNNDLTPIRNDIAAIFSLFEQRQTRHNNGKQWRSRR